MKRDKRRNNVRINKRKTHKRERNDTAEKRHSKMRE